MSPPQQIKNEIGNRYGKLLVIGRDKNSGTKAKWKCLCDCGEEISVVGYDLRSGKSSSCGCGKSKNEIGNRYGSLVVIRYHKERSLNRNPGAYWICRCDCGREISIHGHSLRQGVTKSCGHNSNLPSGDSSFRKLMRIYKANALKRSLDFTLTEDEFRSITRKNCAYCGDPPSNRYRESRYDEFYFYSGIDRVDSSMGYVIDNCVPCCKRCNWAKGKSSASEYMSWLDRIVERRYKNG